MNKQKLDELLKTISPENNFMDGDQVEMSIETLKDSLIRAYNMGYTDVCHEVSDMIIRSKDAHSAGAQ